MKVKLNATPAPPSREGTDPIQRVTVQFVGDKGESLGVCVMPRTFWDAYLRPVLLTGTAVNGLHLTLEDQTL